MAMKKINHKENAMDKEKLLKAIIDQLKSALPGLKEHFDEKKFKKRITRAAEILIHGIKIPPSKKVITVKKKIARPKSKN